MLKTTASLPFNYQLKLLSETAVLLTFDNKMDMAINALATGLHRYWLRQPFAGLVETVPGYNSIAIFTDLLQLHYQGQSPMEAVEQQVQFALAQLATDDSIAPAAIKTIPVRYDGPDLLAVAQRNQIDTAEVVALHTAGEYRVFMMGFQPGFAYMGMTDAKIFTERKEKPVPVAAGSVGLAGNQTGIYPQASPGGWQIIGHTETLLFNADAANPFYLQAGDIVKFVAV